MILASASWSRQMLLKAAGVDFQIRPADLNEPALMADLKAQNAEPAAVALALAEQKALMVSRRSPDEWVLGGDSVLVFGDELISKCSDLDALLALLRRLSGKSHALISAAALARNGEVRWRHAARAQLTMRPLSEAFLEAYIAQEGETVLSCVGGYRYEGPGAQLFERVEGDYFTVLGLPLLPVLAALRDQGILQS